MPRAYVRVSNRTDLNEVVLPNPYGWAGSAASLAR